MPDALASCVKKSCYVSPVSRRTMLRNAALASSVVASMPIVVPLTSPASANCCRTQVKTARWVSRSISRRVREIVEWSGVGSCRSRSKKLRTLSESAARHAIARSSRGLEIPEQQQPKVSPRRETGTPHDLGVERRARALDERIELRLVQHAIQPPVERMRRATRQILRGHPHRGLARAPFAFAHRHAQSLVHAID